MATLTEIETMTKQYAAARADLSLQVGTLTGEIEVLKRRLLPVIKRRVAAAKDARATLEAAIKASPDLFVKPRTLSIHGVKVGFAKGKGKIEFEDGDQVVKLIRKHFPEQFDVLVKTSEKPVKDALQNLSVSELKKLGITVEETGDAVVIKDMAADIDKLVTALLKEDNEGDDE